MEVWDYAGINKMELMKELEEMETLGKKELEKKRQKRQFISSTFGYLFISKLFTYIVFQILCSINSPI